MRWRILSLIPPAGMFGSPGAVPPSRPFRLQCRQPLILRPDHRGEALGGGPGERPPPRCGAEPVGRVQVLPAQGVEHVRVARRLVSDHPDVGAIVLECTNMPPYADDVRRALGLPVFDIVSLVTLAHRALAPGLAPRPA